MNDEQKQAFIDDVIEHEQRDYPLGTIDVLEAVVTELADDFIVYVVYSLTTPAWKSKAEIEFPESTRIVYIVRPSNGGGSSGFLAQ